MSFFDNSLNNEEQAILDSLMPTNHQPLKFGDAVCSDGNIVLPPMLTVEHLQKCTEYLLDHFDYVLYMWCSSEDPEDDPSFYMHCAKSQLTLDELTPSLAMMNVHSITGFDVISLEPTNLNPVIMLDMISKVIADDFDNDKERLDHLLKICSSPSRYMLPKSVITLLQGGSLDEDKVKNRWDKIREDLQVVYTHNIGHKDRSAMNILKTAEDMQDVPKVVLRINEMRWRLLNAARVIASNNTWIVVNKDEFGFVSI